jgi:heat shock protein HslJ
MRHFRIPLTSTLSALVLPLLALTACASGGDGDAPEPLSTLEALTLGETWVLRSIRGMDSVPESGQPEIQFLINGRLTGNTGCNRMNGRYELDGVAVDFDGLATTRMACEDVVGELEGLFIETLRGARYLELGPEFLDLFDGDGARMARFSRR